MLGICDTQRKRHFRHSFRLRAYVKRAHLCAMRKVITGLAIAVLVIGLAVVFGRYDYLQVGDQAIRVDRLTGHTAVLRPISGGGAVWIQLRTPEEVKAESIRSWETPRPQVSPH